MEWAGKAMLGTLGVITMASFCLEKLLLPILKPAKYRISFKGFHLSKVSFAGIGISGQDRGDFNSIRETVVEYRHPLFKEMRKVLRAFKSQFAIAHEM